MFEEQFQAALATNIFFDFLDLPMRQSFPARANWSVFPQAVEKKFDRQGKPHSARESDEEHTVQGVLAVATLAAGAVRRSEMAASPNALAVTVGLLARSRYKSYRPARRAKSLLVPCLYMP